MAINPETADPAQVVSGLVGAIKTIAADTNYTLLANTFDEVVFLRQKNAELISNNRNVFEQYWAFRKDLEEAQEKLRREKSVLEVDLAGKEQELVSVTEDRDQLSSQLKSMELQLSDVVDKKASLENDLKMAQSEIERIQAAKDTLGKDLAKTATQLEDQTRLYDEAQKNNDRLQELVLQHEVELHSAHKSLDQSQKELQKSMDEKKKFEESLNLVQANLTSKTARLQELEGYKIELREESEDYYILDNIWMMLFKLVQSHFHQDLDESVLKDPSCWVNLWYSPALKNTLRVPLPRSNSPVAKAMRISAILAILARELHKYIFRPVYLMDNDEELADYLHDIAFDDPAREETIRATLLATFPEIQRFVARERVQRVVSHAAKTVQQLLGPTAFDAFRQDADRVCTLVCDEWQRLQHTKAKIDVYFGPPYDDFDWQLLPLAGFGCFDSPASKESKVQKTSSSGEVSGSDTAVENVEAIQDGDHSGEGNGVVLYGKAAEIDAKDILLVVWPTMVRIEPGEHQAITQGLVISKGQAHAAFSEWWASQSIPLKSGHAMTVPCPESYTENNKSEYGEKGQEKDEHDKGQS